MKHQTPKELSENRSEIYGHKFETGWYQRSLCHQSPPGKAGPAMKQDILIVLSRKDQPELICAVLAHHGITATLAEDVQNAIFRMESHSNAFLLLDLDLEGAGPFLEKVVTSFYDPPPYLLAVDAFPDSVARTKALNLGADACIEKPVDAEEILAVINAALRRAKRLIRPRPLQPVPCIEYGELLIDPLRRIVKMREQPITLTVKEFDILYLLASYPGIVFSKSQIYERVWNEEYRFATTSVSDHISSLRQKLGLTPKDGRYIQTVFGVGYRFAAEAEQEGIS